MSEALRVLPAASGAGPHARICRLCEAPLSRTFVDLGMSPLCESFLTVDQADQMEPYFPLHVLVCDRCFLVQLQEYVKPEHIFTEYAYFSSFSTSWVEHARKYCDMIKERLGLGPSSQVFEVASNDGYLLQHFLPLGVPVTRHRAGCQRRGGRAQEERTDDGGVLRHRVGEAAGRRGPARPISSSATTCWRKCRTSTSSSPAWRIC